MMAISWLDAVTIRDTGRPPIVMLVSLTLLGSRPDPLIETPAPSVPSVGDIKVTSPGSSKVKLMEEIMNAPVFAVRITEPA